MLDERIRKLAKLLVNYSVFVKKGENVMIAADTEAAPLVNELYKQILLKGAFPFVNLGTPEMGYIFFKNASDAQLRKFPSVTFAEIKKMHKYISIGSPLNTRELTNIDPTRITMRAKVTEPIRDYIANGKPKIFRCTLDFPTNALAQDAEMSLEEYENFLYGACLQDWPKLARRFTKVRNAFNSARLVEIIGEDTHLVLTPHRGSFVIDDGHENMPGGEVFGAPKRTSVEGHIRFTYPAIRSGVEVTNIYAEFKSGRCIKATADKNQKFLTAMLDTDAGSRYIGELGIGMNPRVTKFTKNLLFDEKITGTIHLAFGMAYKECGATNRSAIHWDIVKDLRKGGRIVIDGRVVQKNGKWRI
ncbi:MAG: aminopeptidase [Candidatus Aenigmatarchaeota archaeon]